MNQKPLRTLLLWILWAAMAIMAYTLLYMDSDVWGFVRNDSSRITWLILILFAIGLAGSFILAIKLTLETMIAFQIEELTRNGGLKEIAGRRYRFAIGRFFRHLKATIEGNGQPEIESMLNVELASYQRMSHSTEVIGNLLITLGLIGTVMGLTLTLTGLTGSLEALGEDQELLLAGLRQAMAGMGTAFYTTLLGAVLGGVLLRVFGQITEHGYDALYDKVVHTCLVNCSADLKSTAERDMRFLASELAMLGEQLEELQPIFIASQEAMGRLRHEASAMRQQTQEENRLLRENIQLRQTDARLMLEEIKRLRAFNRPWSLRLRHLLGSSKDDDQDSRS